MKFGAVSVAACAGAILAHGQSIGQQRWHKGRQLTQADASALAAAGCVSVVAALPEPGDIGEDEAARRVAGAIAGPGFSCAPAVHGRVNLIAMADGLAAIDARQVLALNLLDDAVTIATVRPFEPVARGDIAATIKIIPFFITGAVLERFERIASPPVRLHPFGAMAVGLVHTTLPALKDSVIAKTASVTATRLARLGARIAHEARCAHEVEALAATLKALPPLDLVLIVAASAITDAADVVPAAIMAAGGRLERVGMPVDPGNLLCLARLEQAPVIGLPGCARSPKRNGFDLVLERLCAGLPVTRHDIASMSAGGLLEETSARLEPRRSRAGGHDGPVGVLLLAAGASRRMGPVNKLLAPLRPDRTVLGASLANVQAAGLTGTIVVTGHQAEQVRSALAGKNVILAHCADADEGIAASLRAGIAAVPASWSAVIVALGDMPLVPPDVFAGLAQAWRTGSCDVWVPTYEGKRGNPVLWGRRHFAALARLEGDVGAKAILAGLTERIGQIEVQTAGIFQDIDTPDDLAALTNPPG